MLTSSEQYSLFTFVEEYEDKVQLKPVLILETPLVPSYPVYQKSIISYHSVATVPSY